MEKFTLVLIPEGLKNYGDYLDWHLPTFETVLRPLLEKAKDCYVYGVSEKLLNSSLRNILIKDRGKHRLDLTKEVINGYEFLWNGKYPERGSIVIVLEPDHNDFSSIFANCFNMYLFDNPNSGHTPGAVRFCKKLAEQGAVALCLTETNHFEWLAVFAPEEYHLLEQAIGHCGTQTNISDWEPFKAAKRKLPGSNRN